jgi:hypothetical protein
MTALSCNVTNESGGAPEGLEIRLQYITDRRHFQGIEFKSHILKSGGNGKWEARGAAGRSLEYFLSQICPSHESWWHLIFRTGKYLGRDEISFLMVPVFISLCRTEQTTVRLTYSRDEYHIKTTVAAGAEVRFLSAFVRPVS